MGQTLYESLGQSTAGADGDRGRTERTAAVETIDRDRGQTSLYSRLSSGVVGGRGIGRTEITRADVETVDRDRQAPYGSSALFGVGDLYEALGQEPDRTATGRGRTAVTESTESIDWDRPPIGPWT